MSLRSRRSRFAGRKSTEIRGRRRPAESKAKELAILRGQRRRRTFRGSGVTGIMATRGLGLSVLKRSVLVFLTDVSFHARVALVDIGGNWRLDIFGVEDFVHDVVAVGFHILL